MGRLATPDIRAELKRLLEMNGDFHEFSDSEPLASNGRLDQFGIAELIRFLECAGVHLDTACFNPQQIDSVEAIARISQ